MVGREIKIFEMILVNSSKQRGRFQWFSLGWIGSNNLHKVISILRASAVHHIQSVHCGSGWKVWRKDEEQGDNLRSMLYLEYLPLKKAV